MRKKNPGLKPFPGLRFKFNTIPAEVDGVEPDGVLYHFTMGPYAGTPMHTDMRQWVNDARAYPAWTKSKQFPPKSNPKVKTRLLWDEPVSDRGWAALAKHPDARGSNDLWANEVRTVGNYLDYGKGSPGQSRGAAGNVMATAYLTRIDPMTRMRHEHRLGSQWFATKREAKAWIAKKVWAALRASK